MRRVRQVVVALVGLFYVGLLYPLCTELWHSKWLLQMQDNECEPMFPVAHCTTRYGRVSVMGRVPGASPTPAPSRSVPARRWRCRRPIRGSA